MIYLVTLNTLLESCSDYTIITPEKSLEIMTSWDVIQYDSETNGKNCHLCKLLTMQFGNKKAGIQIVVDCDTIDPRIYKPILESKYLIGHNLVFDLQFLYCIGIIPLKVYDTMIVEQFLHLGFPPGQISYSLQSTALRYLGIYIDKTVRGQIIYKGICKETIIYGAGDVVHLENIAEAQYKECEKNNCIVGAKLECDVVPAMAYLHWCGIKLDENKWKAKMQKDADNLDKALKALNDYCVSNPKLSKWAYQDVEGNLWDGFDDTIKFHIDWQKDEAKEVFKALGFDINVINDKGNEAESVREKNLITQKGIDDTFLKLYLDYQGYYKVTTSFGKGHLNLINPVTGRLHTNYWQIGTSTGRMSSGSGTDDDLAKYKKLKEVKMVNMQQLPHDKETRACFVAEKGNLFCSCDYSAMEARIGAEVYNEKKLLDEFLYGSGDTHAAYAKAVFAKELEGIDTKDIKAKRPDLRNKVKSVEFAVQFGSDGTAVAPQLGISVEEAKALVTNLLSGMKGLAAFKIKGSNEVMKNGYVLIMPQTGHKQYWWDYDEWKKFQEKLTYDFWKEEWPKHKGTNDDIARKVRIHFQAKSTWDRAALNSPTQGGGAIVLKTGLIELFNWIVSNNYFGKILLCNVTHDEINTEFPKELKETYPKLVQTIMQEAAAKYYHKLPIPAEAEVGDYWIH